MLGRERTVRIVDHLVEYRKTVSIPLLDDVDLARVAVPTTPHAEVGGQSVDPVGRLSDRELLGRFADRTVQVGNLTRVNDRTVRSLGADRTVRKFAETVERDGREVAVSVHATSFERDGDYVVLAAVHPGALGDEQDDVDEFLRSPRH